MIYVCCPALLLCTSYTNTIYPCYIWQSNGGLTGPDTEKDETKEEISHSLENLSDTSFSDHEENYPGLLESVGTSTISNKTNLFI